MKIHHAIHILLPTQLLLFILQIILTTSLSPTTSKLRNLIKNPTTTTTTKAIPLPGVHDALSAKIFAQAGAPALFLSGFGVSASHLGSPDAGLLTLTEMASVTRCVTDAIKNSGVAVPVPVVVDGDTGYGGTVNIRRTILSLADAGAAAVTIEDQVFPKRCTYAAGAGVRVVSRGESVERIRTAVGVRDESSTDVLIIARTDCRAATSLEEVIARCRAFEELGADVVYAENLQSKSEYLKLRESLRPETPMVLAQVQQSSRESSELYSLEEVGDMGYCLALFGVTALQTTVGSLRSTARDFLARGGILKGDDSLAPFSVVKDVVGFSELDDFVARYEIE